MYTIERGVLENSTAYFHTPSQIAKSIFFYLVSAGHFYCDNNYYLKRDCFDSFLIMYIKSGEGTIYFNGQTLPAKANDVILLNCHKPHAYKATENWETTWCHFDGNVSTDYFNLLYTSYGCVFPLERSSVIPGILDGFLETLHKGKLINEALTSCQLQQMLAELNTNSSDYTHAAADQTNPMLKAITYIKQNYSEKISLNQLADHLCMSIFHFSRVFKKSTGYAPYEYITMVRLNHAKALLKTTNLPIKEITFQTGFNSEANFITCFKQHTKYTPSEFRKMPF